MDFRSGDSEWTKRQPDHVKAAVRRRVERYGLRVVCLACGARGRHRPSIDGRLRKRPCPKCGGRLRTVHWCETHEAAAAAEAHAERKLRALTAAWD